MTVAELLARTTSHELTEWRAYEQSFGPLGPERGDWNAATVAHVVAAANAGKRAKRLKITDFLLTWGRKRQTGDEMLATLKTLQARQRGFLHDDDR